MVRKGLLALVLGALVLAVSVQAQEAKPVVLVSDNPADYAVAQLLAERINATLVTTPWGTLSDEAVNQIKSLGATKVYVVGGPVAVPDVESKLKGVEIERIAGEDRYETAAMAAAVIANLTNVSGVVIAEGMDEDGIREALEYARKTGAPVLFVIGEDVPDAVREVLKKLRPKKAHIVPAPNMNRTKIEEEVKEHGAEEISESKVDFAERAAEAIQDAREEIAEADFNTTNITSGWELAAARLLTNAKLDLKRAETAFNESKYGEAFGLAVAAKHEAKAAKKIIEHVAPGYFKHHVEEAEKEIEEKGLEKAREELEKAEERLEEKREKEKEKREKMMEKEEEEKEWMKERAKAGRQEDGEFEKFKEEYKHQMNETREFEHEEEGE